MDSVVEVVIIISVFSFKSSLCCFFCIIGVEVLNVMIVKLWCREIIVRCRVFNIIVRLIVSYRLF